MVSNFSKPKHPSPGSLPFSWIVLVYLLVAVFVVAPTRAQTTTGAVCQAGWEWAYNELGQNPCLVSAYLGGVCTNGVYFVPTIASPSAPYAPPGPQNPDVNCACSSVFYSTLMACAACQGAIVDLWSTWIQACPQSSIGVTTYPYPIPPGTAVPEWAYMDVTVANAFNISGAFQEVRDANSASAPSPLDPTSTGADPEESVAIITVTQQPSPSPSAITSSSESSREKMVNIGAIAGGAGAAIAVVALAILFIRCFRVRKMQNTRYAEAGEGGMKIPKNYHYRRTSVNYGPPDSPRFPPITLPRYNA